MCFYYNTQLVHEFEALTILIASLWDVGFITVRLEKKHDVFNLNHIISLSIVSTGPRMIVCAQNSQMASSLSQI